MTRYRPRAARLAAVFLVLLFALLADYSHATITELGDVMVGADVQVGITSVGTLTVESPSVLMSNQFSVGVQPSSYGAVRLSGTTWQNTGETIIGWQGRGVFRIEDGAIFANGSQDFVVGGGASGDVSVSGFGTALATLGELRIGSSGTGRFTVSDGGYASSSSTIIGSQQNQQPLSSTATVTGAGSFWETGESLVLGDVGFASLRILDGGAVQSFDAEIGRRASGVGDVEIDGPGSNWTVDYLVLGLEGQGEVVVKNGATLNSSFAEVGNRFAGAGSVVVEGAGSHWQASQGVLLGNGEIVIRDGATALADISSEGSGQVLIDGEGSRLTTSAGFGQPSIGSFTVSNGGLLDVSFGPLQTPVGVEAVLSDGTVRLDPQGRNGGETWFNQGTIRGSGRILGRLDSLGQVLVGAGESLLIEGGFQASSDVRIPNSGRVSVVGGRFEAVREWSNWSGGYFTVKDGTLVVRGTSGQDFVNLVNQFGATLEVDNSDVDFSQASFSDFPNSGDLRFTGGESRFSAGFLDNNGSITVDGESNVTFEGRVASGGTISVAAGSSVSFLDDYEGLEFSGGGGLAFGGALAPWLFPGPFSLGGSVEFAPTSRPLVDIRPNGDTIATEYTVAGPAQLAGELEVRASRPLGPPGETVETIILDAETIAGGFDIVPADGSYLGFGITFNGLTYDTENGDVVMSLTQALEGDFNLDNVVDQLDLGIWEANFGLRFSGDFQQGDADFDRDVDLADLMILQRAMGSSAAAVAAVPEPGAGVLLATALLRCGRRRHWRA